MNKQKIYMIDGDMYEDIVRERVMLYSFVRQLAHAAKRLGSHRDICHLQEMAHLYGEQAEDMFACWDIPKHFLAFGDPDDLDGIKRIELLDYEDGSEDEPGEDLEEAFFRSMRGGACKPRVIVMDLDEILAKMEEVETPGCDSSSGG